MLRVASQLLQRIVTGRYPVERPCGICEIQKVHSLQTVLSRKKKTGGGKKEKRKKANRGGLWGERGKSSAQRNRASPEKKGKKCQGRKT